MSVLGNAIATFAANALKIYNIVHGGPTETVATDGGTVPTFAKLLRDAQSDLSLQTPVAYTAGIVVDSTLETVVYNDVVYSAKESAIPFTTTNWATDETKLRVATLSANDVSLVKTGIEAGFAGLPLCLSVFPDIDPTGTTECGAAINFAFALADGRPIIPEHNATYATAVELYLHKSELRGPHRDYCTFIAVAPMDSVLRGFEVPKISGVKLDANNQADYGFLNDGSCHLVEDCWIEDAMYDGYTNANDTANFNLTRIRGTVFRGNGNVYSTGTATTVASNNTINFTGAPDLTTLKIRPGIDYMYIAACAADPSGGIFQITAVAASSVTVNEAPTVSVTAQPYSIRCGNAINIKRTSDTNAWVVELCTFQVNAWAAIRDRSLYGCRSYSNVVEADSFIYRHNGARFNSEITFGGSDYGTYTESIIYKRYCMEYTDDGFRAFGPTNVEISDVFTHPSTGGGSFYLRDGNYEQRSRDQSGAFTAYINNTYKVSGTGGVITLADPPVGTDKWDQKIVFLLYTNSNESVRFSSSYPINGLAGAEGHFASNGDIGGRRQTVVFSWAGTTIGWFASGAAMEQSITYNVPSIAAGGSHSNVFTGFAGARIADYVQCGMGIPTGGLMITGEVSAANEVRVTWFNPTGSAVDLASTSVYIRVTKQ